MYGNPEYTSEISQGYGIRRLTPEEESLEKSVIPEQIAPNSPVSNLRKEVMTEDIVPAIPTKPSVKA